MSQDEKDKNTYVSFFTGLGYDKPGAENLWEKTKKVKDQFNIPMDKMMACSIYALENHCSITVPLKDMCDIDIEYINNELLPQLENAAVYAIGMAGKSLLELCDLVFDKDWKKNCKPFTDWFNKNMK